MNVREPGWYSVADSGKQLYWDGSKWQEQATSKQQAFRPAKDAPAGWYPLPGGGQRYWDGFDWAGAPVAPQDREPSSPGLVLVSILFSLLFTPLVGLVMGAVRWQKNRGDAVRMIVGGIVIWAAAAGLLYAAR